MSTVLVVEDDPNVRGLLQTLLVSEGYEVITADDGIGGLLKAAKEGPALILLDVMMPDLGGIRVLDQLEEDPALKGIPVMVVTGTVDAVPSLRKRIGEDNVVLKPFGVDALLGRIHDLIGAPS